MFIFLKWLMKRIVNKCVKWIYIESFVVIKMWEKLNLSLLWFCWNYYYWYDVVVVL